MEQDKNKASLSKDQEKELYYGVGSFLWEVVKIFFWAFVIIMPIRVFLFQPFFVQGASMEPNFENGDYLIINELGYKYVDLQFEGLKLLTVKPLRELERGDVAVFRYPKNPKQFFIKRVIGLPGEEVKIKNGEVFIINQEHPEGFKLQENYLPQGLLTRIETDRKLGAKEYFMMGDNRDQSHDSRAWGAVAEDKIIGKVLLRAWPLGKAGIF